MGSGRADYVADGATGERDRRRAKGLFRANRDDMRALMDKLQAADPVLRLLVSTKAPRC